MIKKFSWMFLWGVLVLGAMVAQAQETTEGSAVKLGNGAVLKNTIIWGNKGKQLDGPAGTACYIQAAGLASPKFLDSLNFDFRLSQGSPCWDKGENQAIFGSDALDLWGNKRVRGKCIDIGAHEYTTYEIHFIANSKYVTIEEVQHGDDCDSTHVEPNHTYSFKLNTDLIAGIEARDVIVKKLGEDKPLEPGEGGVYNLPKVNSDISIQIILTPPNEVAVELPQNGTLRVTEKEKGIFIPDGEDEAQKLSMMVAQDKLVVVEATPDDGFYCKEVWMEKADKSKISVKGQLGNPGIGITEAVVFSAEYAPNKYPLKLKVNDAAMVKSLSVSGGGNTYSLPAGSSEWTKTDVEYAKDLSFTITVTANDGYAVKSVKAIYSDGTTEDKTNAVEKKALMKVGGLTIEVEFEGVPCYVSWNCMNGDLNVSPGTVESVSGGGKRVAVGYHQEITIVPAGTEGYEYVSNTLTATPDGETAQDVTDGKWVVTKNTVLNARFQKKKYKITIEAEPSELLNFYSVSSGSLSADGKVEHGASLVLTANAVEGYVCSAVQLDGGALQTGLSSVSLPDIQENKTVKFIFTRKAFTVTYTNTTPAYGTLKVEGQDKDGTTWTEFPANGPETVYYKDKVKATATASAHYHLKSLTVTEGSGTGGDYTVAGNYENAGVTENIAIDAEFAPDDYPVRVEKDQTTTGAEPGEGKIVLKTGTHTWCTLDYADLTLGPVDIPYGTVVTVEVQTHTNYACTELTVNGTKIQPGGTFPVKGPVTVKALIISHITTYKVTVQVDKPIGSTSDLEVRTAGGDLVDLDVVKYDNNTALKVKANQMTDEVCLWVKANGSEMSGEDYTISNADVEFTAKFVKTCTVRIVNPPHSVVTVSRDGVDCPDGTVVPQGVTLKVKIKANTGTGCIYGCRTITADGNPLWTAGAVNPQVQPVAEHTYSMDMAETSTSRTITFGGSDMTFYELQYTAANFGSFEVTADGNRINSGQKYWYPEKTKIGMTALESVTGYCFNPGHKVVNHAVTPETEFVLSPEATAGRYSYTLSELDRNLDLTALFEVKKYPVRLEVELPAGKDLSVVGTVKMSGGSPELKDQGETEVEHSQQVVIEAVPRTGYAVQIKAGGEVKVSAIHPHTATYTSVPVTAGATYTVSFIPLYQISYAADIAKVVREDGTVVANGDWAYAGEKLTAYSALPSVAGKECKRVIVSSFAVSATVYAENTDILANGTVECAFDMPEDHVQVSGVFDWMSYDLAYDLTNSIAGATLKVMRIELGGGETELAVGTGVLNYSDQLKVVVGLPPVEPGSTDTWYEVASCIATMGTENIAYNSFSSGLDRTYILNATVTDDVNITVTLKRRTQNVILQLDPPNAGFSIKLQIDGGTAVEYSDAYREVAVPVGAKVEAWAQMTSSAPEGYELNYFPGVGKKDGYVTKSMPLHENLVLAAKFTLKNYPLHLQVVPAEGGTIAVTDQKGTVYNYNGSSVKYKVDYGTALPSVAVAAASDYYHVEEVTAYMGGIDRFTGQTTPYHIDKIVDSVGIEARFSRRYRVLKDNTIAGGALKVCEADGGRDANGKFYPENTAFTVETMPADESFKCTDVWIEFKNAGLPIKSLSLTGEGKAAYTLPKGLNATDLEFHATFVKKTFAVTLKKSPAEGGLAEIWSGEKPGGTILLQLSETDPETEVEKADVEYGSVLYFYTTAKVPDYEEIGKKIGTSGYTGPVTLVSDTTFGVEFGRLYTLTFGTNIKVWKADDPAHTPLGNGTKVPAGLALVTRAELTGHNCTGLVAQKAGGAFKSWSDEDGDGIIEEDFVMPEGDVDIQGSFETKKFKVKIIHLPEARAFERLEVSITPSGLTMPTDMVDRNSGSSVEYLSRLKLEVGTVQLHPWYEGPVTVTAFKNNDPTLYDLTVADVLVTDSVTIQAKAHRKQKTLTVKIDAETLAEGNEVEVVTEDGTSHLFTTDGSLTVKVGEHLKITTRAGTGCKVTLLECVNFASVPLPNTPVLSAPFDLDISEMPEENLTLTAHFALKSYPVYFTNNVGGTIVVHKKFNGVDEGIVAVSGNEVKHFTELEIVAQPQSVAYRLKAGGLKTLMGGAAVADPAKISSVTAAVNISAEFERIYEVRAVAPDPSYGTLEISCADTNALGYRYPAGTLVKVKAEPETGYEITALWMNGEKQAIIPEGGEIVCTLPGSRTEVDSVEFRVDYALKKYKVIFIARGEGKMEVEGLPGGVEIIEDNSRVNSDVAHFTQLHISLTPNSDRYLVTKFLIHLPDGSSLPVMGRDTVITIEGATNIEAEFRKFYWVVYGTPEHGELSVKESDTVVRSGARYPGLTAFEVRGIPEEGYELETLSANGKEIVNNSFLLPLEDAVYDTVRFDARFKIRQCQLTVIQPDSGFIQVERLDEYGNWVNLDVSRPLTLDYWTQIRMNADVYNPAGYEIRSLQVNDFSYPIGQVWTMRGDCKVEAVVAPRLYTVTFTDPAFGRLRVETDKGEIKSGERVPYRTELTVTAVPDDPEGYEVHEVKANGEEIGNEGQWTVLQNTEISAVIEIRRWEVNTFVSGEGTLSLYLPDGRPVQSPSDIVDHYTVLKISPVADPNWKLYTLEVDGADMQPDSTIRVTQDVNITAVFRQKETLLFPVAFTPNGDGYNDTWVISGLWQAPENTLEIFNRDQQRIYKASPYMNEWGGTTDNGNILPAGTYIYKFKTGTGEEYMGLVSIVRN